MKEFQFPELTGAALGPVVRELALLVSTRHPLVIELVGYVLSGEGSYPCVSILTEWCAGDLYDALLGRADPHTGQRGPLPELGMATRVRLGCGAAAGVAHLHGLGLVHRDIKAANFLYVGQLPLGDTPPARGAPSFAVKVAEASAKAKG